MVLDFIMDLLLSGAISRARLLPILNIQRGYAYTMTSVDFRDHENMQTKIVELEKKKPKTEFPFGQMLEAINFKAQWSLTKKYCRTFQRLFPELDLHLRLLKVALVDLDDMEHL